MTAEDLVLVMCPGWGVSQPPLGISYLAGFLKKRGMRVRCLDLSLELYKVFPEKKYWELNFPEFFAETGPFRESIFPYLGGFIDAWAREILRSKPSAVGFSLFMSNTQMSFLMARHLKKIAPGLVVIGGGPEVTRMRRIMAEGARGFAPLDREAILGGAFDVFIDQEGEEALAEVIPLIKEGKEFRHARGLVYPEAGRLVANAPRPLLADLDVLPPPDFKDYDLEAYTRRSLPVSTSRGCVNRCTFCADSPLWKTYRRRSALKVAEEISALLAATGRDEFEIVDSLFNGDIVELEKLCDLITRGRLPVRWSAKVAVRKEMTPALLKKMKTAGCMSLAYGVESGSPAVLRDMRKNPDLALTSAVIRNSWKAGIQVNCFFIIGYPTETGADFQMTLDFIRDHAAYIHRFDQVTGCHIEDDSYLGLNLEKYGITLESDGWRSPQSTPEIRRDRLKRFREFARELHRHYECEVQS